MPRIPGRFGHSCVVAVVCIQLWSFAGSYSSYKLHKVGSEIVQKTAGPFEGLAARCELARELDKMHLPVRA
jgi:hypothetical protein